MSVTVEGGATETGGGVVSGATATTATGLMNSNNKPVSDYNVKWIAPLSASVFSSIGGSSDGLCGEPPIKPHTCFQSCAETTKFVWIFGGEKKSNEKSAPKILLNDLCCYDKELDEWRLIKPDSPIPPPRKGASLVYDGKNLILFGGSGASQFFNDIWVFNLKSNQWRDITNNVLANSCAALNDESIVYDGEISAAEFASLHPDVYPEARAYHTACVAKSSKSSGTTGELYMFLFGGYSMELQGNRLVEPGPSSSIYKLDLKTLVWECFPYEGVLGNEANVDHPGHRFGHVSVSLLSTPLRKNVILLACGQYLHKLTDPCVWIFDPNTHKWSLSGKPKSPTIIRSGSNTSFVTSDPIPPTSQVNPRTYAAGTVLGPYWLIHGGWGEDSWFDDMVGYNLMTSKWVTMETLKSPIPLEGHSAFVVDHGVHKNADQSLPMALVSVVLVGGSTSEDKDQTAAAISILKSTIVKPLELHKKGMVLPKDAATVFDRAVADAVASGKKIESIENELKCAQNLCAQLTSLYEDLKLQNEALQDRLNLISTNDTRHPSTTEASDLVEKETVEKKQTSKEEGKSKDVDKSKDDKSKDDKSKDAEKLSQQLTELKVKHREMILKYNNQLREKRVLLKRQERMNTFMKKVIRSAEKNEQLSHRISEILRTAPTLPEARNAGKPAEAVTSYVRKLHEQIRELKEMNAIPIAQEVAQGVKEEVESRGGDAVPPTTESSSTTADKAPATDEGREKPEEDADFDVTFKDRSKEAPSDLKSMLKKFAEAKPEEVTITSREREPTTESRSSPRRTKKIEEQTAMKETGVKETGVKETGVKETAMKETTVKETAVKGVVRKESAAPRRMEDRQSGVKSSKKFRAEETSLDNKPEEELATERLQRVDSKNEGTPLLGSPRSVGSGGLRGSPSAKASPTGTTTTTTTGNVEVTTKVSGTKKTTKTTTVIKKTIGPDGTEHEEVVSRNVDTRQEKIDGPTTKETRVISKVDTAERPPTTTTTTTTTTETILNDGERETRRKSATKKIKKSKSGDESNKDAERDAPVSAKSPTPGRDAPASAKPIPGRDAPVAAAAPIQPGRDKSVSAAIEVPPTPPVIEGIAYRMQCGNASTSQPTKKRSSMIKAA